MLLCQLLPSVATKVAAEVSWQMKVPRKPVGTAVCGLHHGHNKQRPIWGASLHSSVEQTTLSMCFEFTASLHTIV